MGVNSYYSGRVERKRKYEKKKKFFGRDNLVKKILKNEQENTEEIGMQRQDSIKVRGIRITKK